MKVSKILSVLTLSAAIGLGATAYASQAPVPSQTSNNTSACLRSITGNRGYDYISNILKTKFNMSDADITKERTSGKTMRDIAKDKGMTDEAFKNSLLQAKYKDIDTAVSNKVIDKTEGDAIKAKIKANIENCNGSGKGNGNGCGMGRGNGNCHR